MGIAPLTFAALRVRLLAHLRTRIRNGELTERSFARVSGISQPHIHNVLKGAKQLSPELADVILASLRISPLDLLSRDEITQHLHNTSPHRESRLHAVPVLNGLLGLHQPIPRKGPHREVHTVPFHLTESATDPLVASLAADPEMAPLFAHRDMVLLDQSETARTLVQSAGYYVVRTPDGPCIRALQYDAGRLFLITERNKDRPEAWTEVSLSLQTILDVVIARVIWLNRRRRWEDHVA